MIFLVSHFEFKKKKLPYHNENKQPVHMRYHLFLQYDWFLQNLGKEAVRTNMHTTVCNFQKSHLEHWQGGDD